MRTTITSIRRYGTLYRVSLACGHQYTCTADEIRQQQLFIGKAIACGELHHIEE